MTIRLLEISVVTSAVVSAPVTVFCEWSSHNLLLYWYVMQIMHFPLYFWKTILMDNFMLLINAIKYLSTLNLHVTQP